MIVYYIAKVLNDVAEMRSHHDDSTQLAVASNVSKQPSLSNKDLIL